MIPWYLALSDQGIFIIDTYFVMIGLFAVKCEVFTRSSRFCTSDLADISMSKLRPLWINCRKSLSTRKLRFILRSGSQPM